MSKQKVTRVDLTKSLSELKLRDILSNQPWGLVCDDSFRALFKEWGIPDSKLISVDDVNEDPDEVPLPKVIVICTEKPERLTQLELRERDDIQTLGLFSQLIPRLAAGLPPRWKPRAGLNVKLEYAIVCLPRSGSTLVARELKEIGAGNPTEHLRGTVQVLLRERAVTRFEFSRWWTMVRSGHNVNGIFATKIIFDFLKMSEQFMTPKELEEIREFLKSVPIIYIERLDKFGQAASDAIARQTGVWHLWSKDMKDHYDEKLEGLDGNFQDAISTYQKFRRNESELRKLLDSLGSRVIRIDYQDLMDQPKVAIAKAAEELGLEIPKDYLSTPLTLQPTTSEVHRRLRDRLEAELR